MEENFYNVEISKDIFRKKKEEERPKTIYVNMQLMIDKYMRPWVDDFKKAFALLDKANEYNIVILLKADSCTVGKKLIEIENLKKTMIINR